MPQVRKIMSVFDRLFDISYARGRNWRKGLNVRYFVLPSILLQWYFNCRDLQDSKEVFQTVFRLAADASDAIIADRNNTRAELLAMNAPLSGAFTPAMSSIRRARNPQDRARRELVEKMIALERELSVAQRSMDALFSVYLMLVRTHSSSDKRERATYEELGKLAATRDEHSWKAEFERIAHVIAFPEDKKVVERLMRAERRLNEEEAHAMSLDAEDMDEVQAMHLQESAEDRLRKAISSRSRTVSRAVPSSMSYARSLTANVSAGWHMFETNETESGETQLQRITKQVESARAAFMTALPACLSRLWSASVTFDDGGYVSQLRQIKAQRAIIGLMNELAVARVDVKDPSAGPGTVSLSHDGAERQHLIALTKVVEEIKFEEKSHEETGLEALKRFFARGGEFHRSPDLLDVPAGFGEAREAVATAEANERLDERHMHSLVNMCVEWLCSKECPYPWEGIELLSTLLYQKGETGEQGSEVSEAADQSLKFSGKVCQAYLYEFLRSNPRKGETLLRNLMGWLNREKLPTVDELSKASHIDSLFDPAKRTQSAGDCWESSIVNRDQPKGKLFPGSSIIKPTDELFHQRLPT